MVVFSRVTGLLRQHTLATGHVCGDLTRACPALERVSRFSGL